MTPHTAEIPLPREQSALDPQPASRRRGRRTPMPPTPGSWGELLSPDHLPAALVLAGGVAMYATNVYVTAALLPSAITEIGGAQYFAWVATAFLTASVVSSMLVTRVLARFGAARAYTGAFLLFALGTLGNTVAPSMEVLLVGRAIQGLGGGLLAGLGYAVIRSALPERLWTRAAGLVSAMWGVGNLVGPTLGGLFAQWGIWRGAFALLAVVALLLAWVSRRAVPGSTAEAGHLPPIPVLSLVLLSAAAAAFSVTSVVPRGIPTVVGLAAAVGLLLGFVLRERVARATVLPRATYRRGNPLKWIYLTLGLLSAGAMAEAFVPLFGQELAGLPPLAAGFLGASLSVGWTAAQLVSVTIERPPGRRLVMLAGPAFLALGLFAYAALVTEGAALVRVAAWAAALFAAGAGIGMAFPHLSVAAMRSSLDPAEGRQAAAGVSTTQLIANSVSSAIVGILVAAGGPSALGSAQAMSIGIGVLAVLGIGTALLASRGSRQG
ncbi:MFS transporter [Leucobacter rhizosphaerae]|uniref:MFS transporter n=1 Tax=Leucobacter rhizosphaerae TaxID=2932245 RepID=A0ABY4FYV7_9MICO|nr:MFS transporter [Leucobacter rhizosphaerae]UOQ61448.1 MFS transporter [Leucobacter rhizosphaerae]